MGLPRNLKIRQYIRPNGHPDYKDITRETSGLLGDKGAILGEGPAEEQEGGYQQLPDGIAVLDSKRGHNFVSAGKVTRDSRNKYGRAPGARASRAFGGLGSLEIGTMGID